jgi:hypothetical protein
LARIVPKAIDEELRPYFDNLEAALKEWIECPKIAAQKLDSKSTTFKYQAYGS